MRVLVVLIEIIEHSLWAMVILRGAFPIESGDRGLGARFEAAKDKVPPFGVAAKELRIQSELIDHLLTPNWVIVLLSRELGRFGERFPIPKGCRWDFVRGSEVWRRSGFRREMLRRRSGVAVPQQDTHLFGNGIQNLTLHSNLILKRIDR